MATDACFSCRHNIYTSQYLTAFPDAKAYIPNRTAESWAKDKTKEAFIPRIAHTFGKGLGDPFATATGGEIQTADWGAAHANEVRTLLISLAPSRSHAALSG